jgi:hypothetical protein
VYGIERRKIGLAGRTDPPGKILLASDNDKLKLRDGDTVLLRIE